MVGLCVRLCIQLGYHQERTIMLSETPLDPITKDMRRRLFWTLASMEYGLSHVLGRPSAFATSDAHIDVKFYEPVGDQYITAGGILPGPPSTKKLISMHFFEMRRLQAEIRQTLYTNPRPHPKSDHDPWFAQMHNKCVAWKSSCPHDDEGSGLSEIWFNHRFNNILIFMYRPSPQIPSPSLEATLMCYDCAVANIHLERTMVEQRLVDLTWVFMHQIYTVTLTLIWTVYNPEIRRQHTAAEIHAHISMQITLLHSLDARWPGASAAANLFHRLARAALRNYEFDGRKSTSASPPPPRPPPPPPPPQSQNTFSTPPPQQGQQPLGTTQSPDSAMITDPHFMQAMFFNQSVIGGEFMAGWNPGIEGYIASTQEVGVVEVGQQREELMRILEREGQWGTGGGWEEGGGRAAAEGADLGRAWFKREDEEGYM